MVPAAKAKLRVIKKIGVLHDPTPYANVQKSGKSVPVNLFGLQSGDCPITSPSYFCYSFSIGEVSMKKLLVIGSAILCTAVLGVMVLHAQQDKSKRPSPPATTKCDLPGGKSVTVDYSSPRAKGRQVFGGIVPYGEPWRTGANEATTFVTTADLMVGGKHVAAGNYTLFTVPNKDKWELIISKKTN